MTADPKFDKPAEADAFLGAMTACSDAFEGKSADHLSRTRLAASVLAMNGHCLVTMAGSPRPAPVASELAVTLEAFALADTKPISSRSR